jgi:HK97 family phage portal protein
LAQVPVHIYNGENEIEWPYDVKFKTLIKDTEAALCLAGAAYWLKEKNNVATQNLVWLNPFSVEIDYRFMDGQEIWTFTQPLNGSGPWSQDDIVYFREWDPLQDTNPGISPTQVALGDSQLLNYVTRFAYHFFEGGAMPVTVLGVTGTTQGELNTLESKFKRALTNVKNAFKIFGMRAEEIDIKTLTPPMDTLALPELYDQARNNVAAAFGVPSTMLEDPAANRAVADTHRLSFWGDTMKPRGEYIEETINEQLFDPIGLRFEFGFDELDIFQEDENQRAASIKAYVDAGMPLDLACEILGVDMTEEQTAQLQAHLEQKKAIGQALAANLQKKPQDNKQDDDNSNNNGAKSITTENMHGHLGLWQKKAKNRLKSRKNPAVDFESPYIPAALNGAILGALDSARTVEDIDRIFDSIWGAYP